MMKIGKKKSQTMMPYCDEVRTSTSEDLKYTNKNNAANRNTDISVRRVPLAADKTDNHPLLRSRSKQRFI
ncbi:MAG: hypothetical protein ACK4TA_23610 [Saprospiraceae bacterium]